MEKPTHMVTTYSQADADFMIAAAKACHRLGLTAEQLGEGVLDKLVEAAKEFIDVFDNAPEELSSSELRDALRPFTKECRDEK